MKTEIFLSQLSKLSLSVYQASFEAACNPKAKVKAQKALDTMITFIRANADFYNAETKTVFNAQKSKNVTMPADATLVKGPWIPPFTIKGK